MVHHVGLHNGVLEGKTKLDKNTVKTIGLSNFFPFSAALSTCLNTHGRYTLCLAPQFQKGPAQLTLGDFPQLASWGKS